MGLAAGIGALHIAAVMSFCFNYIAYFIWRLGYGAESAERHLRFATEEARAEADRRKDLIRRHAESEDSGGAASLEPPRED